MNSTGWALCLIVGIVLFVIGGKWFSLILMGVGALGVIACTFGRGR